MSFNLIKLNWSEFQIINSSEILEICIEHIETLYKKSKTKSLSATVSIELLVGLLNFNFLVVYHLSILKDVPEILDVVNVKITSKTGADYSSFSYSIEDNLSPEGRVVYIPQDCVWEIKFKSDITGAVR